MITNQIPYRGIRQKAFTLVELIVVIAIIIILAGLVIGGQSYVRDRQARELARVQIQLLSQALEEYHLDNGVYPPNNKADGRGGTGEVYKHLFADAAINKVSGASVYLVELDPANDPQGWLENHEKNASTNKILDPWGREYYYRTNKSDTIYAANAGFDLWSAGPDGRTVATGAGGYDENHTLNKDDIRGW